MFMHLSSTFNFFPPGTKVWHTHTLRYPIDDSGREGRGSEERKNRGDEGEPGGWEGEERGGTERRTFLSDVGSRAVIYVIRASLLRERERERSGKRDQCVRAVEV